MFFLNRTNINDAAEACRRTPGAILLDVREADEYRSGHIPGAISAPLSAIETTTLPKDRPLYVYCLRGMRSRRAARILKRKGYDAKSIGGIASYKGELERCRDALCFAGKARNRHWTLNHRREDVK